MNDNHFNQSLTLQTWQIVKHCHLSTRQTDKKTYMLNTYSQKGTEKISKNCWWTKDTQTRSQAVARI